MDNEKKLNVSHLLWHAVKTTYFGWHSLALWTLAIRDTCHATVAIWDTCHLGQLPCDPLAIMDICHYGHLPFGILAIRRHLPFRHLPFWDTCHYGDTWQIKPWNDNFPTNLGAKIQVFRILFGVSKNHRRPPSGGERSKQWWSCSMRRSERWWA